MKCFTLKAKFFVVQGGHVTPTYSYPDKYPNPEPGIVLDETDRAIVVGWTSRIKASQELLKLSPDTGAIKRNGRQITVYRASIAAGADGQLELVPEKVEDTAAALVLMDVGAGRFLNVRLAADSEQVVTKVRSEGGWGCGYQDHMLARLSPFKPVSAIRSDRRFIFWGEVSDREELRIAFDGENVFYDIIAFDSK